MNSELKRLALVSTAVVVFGLVGLSLWAIAITGGFATEDPDFENPLETRVPVRVEPGLVVVLDELGDKAVFRVTVTVGPKVAAIADPDSNIRVLTGQSDNSEGFDGVISDTIFLEGPDGSIIEEGPDGPTQGTIGVFTVAECVGGCVRTFIVTLEWSAPMPEGSVYPVEEGVEATLRPTVAFNTAEQFRQYDGSGIAPEDLVVEVELIVDG